MAENKKDASPCPRLAITGRSGKYSVCRLEEHLLAQLRADRGGGGYRSEIYSSITVLNT